MGRRPAVARLTDPSRFRTVVLWSLAAASAITLVRALAPVWWTP
ncbi:hypothetical protein [Actinoplanes sichuanensis]|uniref:Uncharacterized protein n=1 Tax=Actinoplanes sichuanensis TaxID=512349 RepID=A0ABW4AXK3_9ACTN|nr:hypothetical protein [Actinoplanes sichuanensis]